MWSLRERGCSGSCGGAQVGGGVVPARAGVFRTSTTSARDRACGPRASGGVPVGRFPSLVPPAWSPRERGCSGADGPTGGVSRTCTRVGTDPPPALGDRIRTARTALKMSQERLCELSGVDQQTINRIELGRHATRIDTLYRIARTLRVPLSDLVRE
ncbi:helix-turn-helix transcriptional regulator [Streptomyces bacillaris]